MSARDDDKISGQATAVVTEPIGRVFLSYSRKDAVAALEIRRHLQARGFEVFRDVDDTLPGEEWWNRLKSLIVASDTVLFILSSNSASSAVCRDEIQFAAHLSKRLLPVALEAVDWSSVPEGLSNHQAIVIDDGNISAMAGQIADALLCDIEWLRTHTQLAARAARWVGLERDVSELLTGQMLTDAEEWLTRRPLRAPAPSASHVEYVTASRQEEVQATQRMLKEVEAQRAALEQERDRAIEALETAGGIAGALIDGLAQRFQETVGVPGEFIDRVLNRTRGLLGGLSGSGQAVIAVELERIRSAHVSIPILCRTGRTREAQADARQSLAVARTLFESHAAEDRVARHLAWALGDLALATEAGGSFDEAMGLYEEAILLASDRLSTRADDTWRLCIWNVANPMTELFVEQDQYDLAERSAIASLKFYDTIEDKNAAGCREAFADACMAAALYSERTGKIEVALRHCLRAKELREQLSETAPQDLRLREALSNVLVRMGSAYRAGNNLVDAHECYEEAAQVRQSIAADDPTNAAYRFAIAEVQLCMADVHMTSGKTGSAITEYQTTANALRDLVEIDPDNYKWKRALAHTYLQLGRDRRATADKVQCRAHLQLAQSLCVDLIKGSGGNKALQRDLNLVSIELQAFGGEPRAVKKRSWWFW